MADIELSCREDVVITDELDQRPRRVADHAGENRALRRLAETLDDPSADVLDELVHAALDLTRSGSAGISLLESGAAGDRFRWVAAAGQFAPHARGTIAREASPCASVVEGGEVMLLRDAARLYPAVGAFDLPIHEILLAPLHRCGETVGTIWAIKHAANDGFDREDARILQSLSSFASIVESHTRTEAQLRRSERRLSALFAASAEYLYQMNADWTEFRLLRNGVAGERRRDWLERFVHPDDRAEVMARAAEAIESKLPFEAEHRVLRSDGSVSWMTSRAIPMLDQGGAIEEWVGAASDVTARHVAVQAERRHSDDLQHRLRNVLAVTRSIVRRSHDEERSAEDYAHHLEGRLDALARTQMLLTRTVEAGVDLEALIRDELLAQVASESRLSLDGPDVEIGPKAAEVLTLAIHELATNATKFGALQCPAGRLAIAWRIERRGDGEWLLIDWRESGVRIVDPAPRRHGFGVDLITRRVPYELRGEGTLSFEPGGVTCTILFPLVEAVDILHTRHDSEGE